uniref:CARD domain-containing protein n=1 Tax=Maylandia zebra TaxID=106582 RepID=A0A3P9BX25_9CICH
IFSMSAQNAIRSNKTAIHEILSGDSRLILNKVYENKLITQWEYKNLKRINNVNMETHVSELVDKIMNKGEDKCKDFLNLLQTDGAIEDTFPLLASLQLTYTPLLSEPVQVFSCQHGNTHVTQYRNAVSPVVFGFLTHHGEKGVILGFDRYQELLDFMARSLANQKSIPSAADYLTAEQEILRQAQVDSFSEDLTRFLDLSM